MEYIYQITDEDIKKAKEESNSVPLFQLNSSLDDDRIFEGIYRQVSPAQFQSYVAAAKSDGANAEYRASLQFIKGVLVRPTFDSFHEMQQNLPALAIGIGNELAKGMGIVRSSEKKSL